MFVLCLLSIGLVGCGGGGGSSSGVVAPTITAQPTSQAVTVGSAASFSVAASGTSLTYQWYKDSTAISGATSTTYSIASTISTDAGTYYAIVKNSGGSVQSSSVTLTVNSASTGSGTVTVQ